MEKLVTFGEAVLALEQGKRVARKGWNGKGLFIIKQVPATIGLDIVPNMQSLPQSVKDTFKNRGLASVAIKSPDKKEGMEGITPAEPFSFIQYKNQLCIVYPNNVLFGYSASTSDALAEDWVILDPDLPKQDLREEVPVIGLRFGEAIENLRAGKTLTRIGWNASDMWLYYVPTAKYKTMTDAAKEAFGDTVSYREYLALKTAQGDVATWSPSNTDVFATDWVVL